MSDFPYLCRLCKTEFRDHLPFCTVCLTDGSVGPVHRRRGAAIDAEAQITNARQLAAGHWSLVDVPACPGLRLVHGALVLLYGQPGAGKSTLALRMLDSIEGAVVAVMAEEHLGPAVAERLGRLRIRRADFHILGRASVDDLVALVRRVRARAVLVDSFTATSLLPTDARHLLQRLELDALLGVVQVTKKGQMAGPKEWEHEADAVLYIEDEQWSLQKSRFQPDRPTGNVFPASPP